MKKFWVVLPKRDVLFILFLFVMTAIIAFFDGANAVRVSFGKEALDIRADQYSMNIPYDMVTRAELMELPQFGEPIDGMGNQSVHTGLWKNSTWGEYYLCIDTDAKNGIVTYLDDGRIFVFNSNNEEKTRKIFEDFLGHLES